MKKKNTASYTTLSKGQLYRLLVQEVKDYAICFLDLQGNVVTWNKGVGALKGYTRDEAIGKHFSIFYTEEDRKSGLPAKLLAAAEEKGRVVDEGWCVRKDGSKFWSRTTLTAVYNKHDEFIGYSKIIHDLTEQEKERQDFKLLSEAVPLLVWSANAEGEAYYFNQRWTEYSGLQPSQLKTTGWMNLVHPDEQEKIKQAWEQALVDHEECSMELRIRNKVGDYYWFIFRCAPIKDSTGEVVRWFGSGTDIHKQRMEVENKSEFVSFATHELRMPLTTIKAYISLLEQCFKEGVNCDHVKYLRKTHVLVDRLNSIISEMHEITKAEAGQMELNRSEFSMSALLREFVETMQQTTRHKLILETNEDAMVNADRDKIVQVLSNYVANGIKYSPKSSKLIIRSRVKHHDVEVSVQDFGIGIPKYKKGKIFSKFYRAKNARKYEGLGLGLYLVKQIVHLHKGRVWMESEENEGSTFYFALPVSSDEKSSANT